MAIVLRRPALFAETLSSLADKSALHYGVVQDLGSALASGRAAISIDEIVSACVADSKSWWVLPYLLEWSSVPAEQATYEKVESALLGALTNPDPSGKRGSGLGRAQPLAAAMSKLLEIRPGQFQRSDNTLSLEQSLSDSVTRLVLARTGLDTPADWELGRKLLVQFGGTGMVQMINGVLAADNPWALRLIIRDAGKHGNEESALLLAKIVDSQTLDGADNHSKERLYLGETALAEQGRWEDVVRTAVRTGYLPTAVLDFDRNAFESQTIDEALTQTGLKKPLSLRNIIIAILLYGHKKYLDFVRKTFDRLNIDDPDLPIVVQCLTAYETNDSKFVERVAVALLHQKEDRLSLVNGLLMAGTPRARRIVLDHAATVLGSGSYPVWYIDVMLKLSTGSDEVARQAREFLIGREKSERFSLTHSEILTQLPDIQGEAAYDLLQRTALSDSNMVVYGQKPSAILGLSKLDNIAACEAIEALFEMRAAVRNQLPITYIKVNEERAVSFLSQRMIVEKSSGTRIEICRSLRLYRDYNTLTQMVETLLEAASLDELLAGIEIAGWWTSRRFQQRLEAIAQDHPVRDMRLSAASSLVRLKHQEWIRAYFDEFRHSTDPDKWRCLEAICRLADPFVLSRNRDPLWVGNALVGAHEKYWNWVSDEIGRQMDKWRSAHQGFND